MTQQFDLIKRELLLPLSHYNETLEDSEYWLIDPEVDKILSDPEKQEGHKRRLIWNRTRTALKLLMLRYSAGEEISSLKPYAERALIMFDNYYKGFPESRLKLWEDDAYQYVMWFLGIVVLFDLKQYAPSIANWISSDPEDGEDLLVSKLFDCLGIQFPGETLIHEKSYGALLRTTETTGEEQQLEIKQYLKQWYKTKKGCYWYDAHKNLKGFFFGYWAFEAGLVTFLWNIDDSEYRNMPYYPKDLIDFARK